SRNPARSVAFKVAARRLMEGEVGSPVPMAGHKVLGLYGPEQHLLVDIKALQSRCELLGGPVSVHQLLERRHQRVQQEQDRLRRQHMLDAATARLDAGPDGVRGFEMPQAHVWDLRQPHAEHRRRRLHQEEMLRRLASTRSSGAGAGATGDAGYMMTMTKGSRNHTAQFRVECKDGKVAEASSAVQLAGDHGGGGRGLSQVAMSQFATHCSPGVAEASEGGASHCEGAAKAKEIREARKKTATALVVKAPPPGPKAPPSALLAKAAVPAKTASAIQASTSSAPGVTGPASRTSSSSSSLPGWVTRQQSPATAPSTFPATASTSSSSSPAASSASFPISSPSQHTANSERISLHLQQASTPLVPAVPPVPCALSESQAQPLRTAQAAQTPQPISAPTSSPAPSRTTLQTPMPTPASTPLHTPPRPRTPEPQTPPPRPTSPAATAATTQTSTGASASAGSQPQCEPNFREGGPVQSNDYAATITSANGDSHHQPQEQSQRPQQPPAKAAPPALAKAQAPPPKSPQPQSGQPPQQLPLRPPPSPPQQPPSGPPHPVSNSQPAAPQVASQPTPHPPLAPRPPPKPASQIPSQEAAAAAASGSSASASSERIAPAPTPDAPAAEITAEAARKLAAEKAAATVAEVRRISAVTARKSADGSVNWRQVLELQTGFTDKDLKKAKVQKLRLVHEDKWGESAEIDKEVGTQACIDLLGAVKLAEKFLNGGVVQDHFPVPPWSSGAPNAQQDPRFRSPFSAWTPHSQPGFPGYPSTAQSSDASFHHWQMPHSVAPPPPTGPPPALPVVEPSSQLPRFVGRRAEYIVD
ncbi:unnamed protein product, partial [Polarella glacialis]